MSSAVRCACLLLVTVFIGAFAVAQDSPIKAFEPLPASVPLRDKVDNGSPALTVRDQSRYILSPGDVIEVSVYGIPELTQKTRISSSGDVSLALVNTVHLGGLHVEDGQAAIERALSDGHFVNNPHVSLLVSEYGSGVEVMGEVAKPGIYPALGSRRLFEILSAAGGTTPAAGRTIAILNRANQTQRNVVLSNEPQNYMEADVLVYQGETVFVPRAGVIYVVGEVLQPSGFVMENRTEYTALRAVAMAHGATKNAKLSDARIVRRNGDGVVEIPVSLDKVVKSQIPDVKLQAEDIVYVPTNKAKVIASRSIELAIWMASSVAIWWARP